jgi:choline transport protein
VICRTPVVGAQYRWTALYAPRGFGSPAFWSLLQGWITVFAWIAVCTQVCFLEGTILQGLIILNDDSYIPKGWHGTLLAWAILALPLLCNVFARRLLAPVEVLGGILHIALFVVFVVVLVTLSPRSSADYVFRTTTTNLSGYSAPGVSWCIGLLSGAFPLAGFDGVLHMSMSYPSPAPPFLPSYL